MVLVGRHDISGQYRQRRSDRIRADVQHVTHPQGAARMAAELAQREGGAAAQVQRHVQPATQCQVGACASALHRAELEHAASFDRVRLPQRQRHAVHSDSHRRAAHGDHGVVMET